jgi:primosomal protein N'
LQLEILYAPPTSKIQDQPPLTKAQLSALKSIEKSKAPIILEGVVGSGKTRIYFEAAQKTLDATIQRGAG